jgi:hypothetical protein
MGRLGRIIFNKKYSCYGETQYGYYLHTPTSLENPENIISICFLVTATITPYSLICVSTGSTYTWFVINTQEKEQIVLLSPKIRMMKNINSFKVIWRNKQIQMTWN